MGRLPPLSATPEMMPNCWLQAKAWQMMPFRKSPVAETD
jgi:hypothetical protein